MKRLTLYLSVLLVAAMVAAGCGNSAGGKDDTSDGTGNDTAGGTESTAESGTMEETSNGVTGVVTDEKVRTGLGIITTLADSTDATEEEEGIAQADLLIAAVTVDAEGRIVACRIDAAQTQIFFGADGRIFSELKDEYPTKQEQGAGYGMKKASSIGKEWNEQADAFAEYCIGKTAEEITGIAVTAEGVAADTDLAASCTIHIGGLQQAVVKAVQQAVMKTAQQEVALSAAAGDKLGLGVMTSIEKSTDATADKEGLAQIYTTISLATVNTEGRITGTVLDAVQVNINFDQTGKITSDLSAEVLSKNELGEDYGMKGASSIGKEWNEQAAAYADYAVGRTAEEVNGTAVTDGVPADVDLAASVTIHITDFNQVITKAVENAR